MRPISVRTPTSLLGALIACLVTPALLHVSVVRADCTRVGGDLSPGELDTATDPPTWEPTGDGMLNVGDVVVALRAAAGLQDIAWADPGPGCTAVAGDYSPGVLDDSVDPPIWRPTGDGMVNIADVVVLLRGAVGVQLLANGPFPCDYLLTVGLQQGERFRDRTDQDCPVDLSLPLEVFVQHLPGVGEIPPFVIDSYSVTFRNLTRDGAAVPGFDVPSQFEVIVFDEPRVLPATFQFPPSPALRSGDKLAQPLLNPDFYEDDVTGNIELEATLRFTGFPMNEPQNACTGDLVFPFAIFDSGLAPDHPSSNCPEEMEMEGN